MSFSHDAEPFDIPWCRINAVETTVSIKRGVYYVF